MPLLHFHCASDISRVSSVYYSVRYQIWVYYELFDTFHIQGKGLWHSRNRCFWEVLVFNYQTDREQVEATSYAETIPRCAVHKSRGLFAAPPTSTLSLLCISTPDRTCVPECRTNYMANCWPITVWLRTSQKRNTCIKWRVETVPMWFASDTSPYHPLSSTMMRKS